MTGAGCTQSINVFDSRTLGPGGLSRVDDALGQPVNGTSRIVDALGQPVHDISHINSAMESLAEIKASQFIASAV